MKKTALTIIFVFLFFGMAGAWTARDIKAGNRLYKQGDYGSAAQRYEQVLKKNPESDIVNFNAGTTLYKKGDYPKAIGHLQKSLLSENTQLKEKTNYNLGNSFFKLGLNKEDHDLDLAISSLEQSVDQYENALKIDAKDQDAQYNHEVAKKELERLKKKQQEQKKKEEQKKTQGQNKPENSPQQNQAGQSQKQNPSSEDKNNPAGSPGQNQDKDQGQSSKGNSAQQDQNQGQDEKASSSEDQPSASRPKNEESSLPASPDDSINNSGQDTSPDTSSSPKGGQVPAGEMSKKEAQQLLDHYQQSDEPQGLLNFMKGKRKEVPVIKDW